MAKSVILFRDWFHNAVARSILGAASLLPYQFRVPVVGWIVAHVVAPVTGWRKRVFQNIDLAMPGTSTSEKRRLANAVADNVGRTLIEIYSGEEFVAHARKSPVCGPGAKTLEEAREAERPVVLVTAHLGNYDAVRGKLGREGFPMAAIYRPMRNAAFQKHYIKAISTIGTPVFPANARGVMATIHHLKSGGTIGMLSDIALTTAPVLSFFGKPAHTPLSAAEWALKYNALLVPIFGIRAPDGLSFTIHVSEPIAHSTPEIMMQAYNDEVERITREHPEQWFWVHKRWKLSKKARQDLSEAGQPPR